MSSNKHNNHKDSNTSNKINNRKKDNNILVFYNLKQNTPSICIHRMQLSYDWWWVFNPSHMLTFVTIGDEPVPMTTVGP